MAQPITAKDWKAAPTTTLPASELQTGHVLVTGSPDTVFPPALILATHPITADDTDYIQLTVRNIDDDPTSDTEPYDFLERPRTPRLVALPRWAP